MAKKKLCISCQRRLSILMVVFGSLLVAMGLVLFALQNRPDTGLESTSEEEGITEEAMVEEPLEGTKSESDVVEEVIREGEKAPSEVDPEEIAEKEGMPESASDTEEESTTASETELGLPITYFSGDLIQYEEVHHRIEDGTLLSADQTPDFHRVASISVEEGTNLKTGNPSDNLIVHLSAVPDRLFTLSVLVSEISSEGVVTSPDQVIGEQWLLSYVDGEFVKAARVVMTDGSIKEHDAEDFNIRFAGNDGSPEVIFYGIPGSKYYGFMIYDEAYFSFVTPIK